MRVLGKVAIAIAFLGVTGASAADDAPPPIRQFDIPTVERLGRAMYEQDQEAWKATDILRSHYTDDQLRSLKMHGWIVFKNGAFDVVRFIRDGAKGPEVLCDVDFSGESPSACNAPAVLDLTSEQLSQYNARLLALKSVERPCSQRYNSVALKDPDHDGWLVWALASTTEQGVVVYGGHYRFTISSDGTRLIQSDALSRGCMNAPPPDLTKGKEVAMAFEQLVSDIPVETSVWLNLQHKTPIILITPNRKTWDVIDGKITQSGTLPAK